MVVVGPIGAAKMINIIGISVVLVLLNKSRTHSSGMTTDLYMPLGNLVEVH